MLLTILQLITNKKNFYNKVINKRIFLKNKFHLSIVIDSVVFVFFRNCNLLHKEHFTTTSYKIINFKSDNGTEYTNKTLTTYLENFAINFIHSVPGYPQQNGRAERLNQNI